ncbi:phage protease [Paracoccus sp. (in: a-proteobacteria)]|uniref:phage protease n=1 Tax=Paracoccus sp. TaxID=267 RepID=UPI0026DF9BE1|nr:phage protease [Paracoccus sp. (in: a-proteobacteria)]MDO5648856.1 phage protease [Paracoccus sp. (in: a-proteobacteria)]
MAFASPPLTRQTGAAVPVDGVPDRIELVPLGQFRMADARGEFRLTDAAEVIERSMAHAHGGALLIDFGHGVQGQAERRSDAAGWITALEIEGDRVMASVDWTPAGRAAIEQKSYRFISPVFFNRPDREVVLITGAGLVNDPGLPQLRQLASKENIPMTLTNIAAALGLGADADEAAIVAAVRDLSPQPQLASVLQAAGVETLTDDTARQICARLTAQPDPSAYVTKAAFDDVTRQLASLQKQVSDEAVETAVTDAKAAGKISPAMEGWARQLAAKDMTAFADFVATAPVILPPGRAPVPQAGAAPGDLTRAERQMCAAMGIDPAKFAATKKQEADHAQNG